MKIVIAPNPFKESLTAVEVCRFIKAGIRKIFPNAKILSVPMADGGDGTMSAMVTNTGGKILKERVTAPLGNKVTARYGLIDKGRTAVIEIAQASGLSLVPPSKRNPMKTTSYGTGELLRMALDRGCRKIILTLGGVATNDCGVGMAQALGYRFLDKSEKEIPRGANGLKRLWRIDRNRVHSKLKGATFIAACDVKNPLCGPHGSAAVYGPQKGATPTMVKEIEIALKNFARIVKRDMKVNVLHLPGAGAAGGAGAGAVAFLNARLKPGIDIVIEITQLQKKIRDADLVITGEGKIDAQTAFGKAPSGVARAAKKYGIPVIAFCGVKGSGAEKLSTSGINAIFPLSDGTVTKEESIKHAGTLLRLKTELAMRIFTSK